MAISDVQICNMALSRIGVSQPISSMSEASNEARMCSLWYAHCRDTVLQAFPWKFARKVSALQDIGTPTVGWSYRFRYPNDCLKALKVSPDASDRIATSTGSILSKIVFDVVSDESSAGKAIVSDQDGLYLHYTAAITDPTLFDPLFTSALAWLLASEIAGPLATKPEYANAARDGYTVTVNEAFATSLNEGYEGSDNTTDLITARY